MHSVAFSTVAGDDMSTASQLSGSGERVTGLLQHKVGKMHAAVRGLESVFVWPSCGHTLHLGCVAHMRVNQAWVSCPICWLGWSKVAAVYDTNSVPTPAAIVLPPPRFD